MTEQQPTADTHDMAWVLNRLAGAQGVEHAVLFTSDGLVLAHSEGLHRDVADRTAASSSSLFSLGRGVGEFAPTPDDTPPARSSSIFPGRASWSSPPATTRCSPCRSVRR